MKSLTANVLGQLSAQSRKPVNLVTMTLDVATLRYCTAKSNFTFPAAGNVYTAKAIQYGDIRTSVEGQVERIIIKLDNTNRDMMGYAVATPFKGRKIEIQKVWRDEVGDPADYEGIITGEMEEPSFDYNWINIPIVAGTLLVRQYPDRTYSPLCGLSFGGSKCNQDGNADLTASPLYVTGTVDSRHHTAGGVTIADAALTQGGDFWNYGVLTCNISGVSENRIVTDFDAGNDIVTFQVPFTTPPAVGAKYSLKKGCTKDSDVCNSSKAWGPSVNNIANFGGFLYIY